MVGASSSRRSAASRASSMPDFHTLIRARLAGLDLSPTREAEIVEELSQHLQDHYDRALSRGASEGEAREAVLEELSVAELGEELKRVERRVPQNPVPMGTQGKSNMIGDLGQ